MNETMTEWNPFLLLFLLTQLSFLNKRMRLSKNLDKPIILIIIFYSFILGIGILTTIFSPDYQIGEGSSISIHVSYEESFILAFYYLVCLNSLLLGSNIYLFIENISLNKKINRLEDQKEILINCSEGKFIVSNENSLSSSHIRLNILFVLLILNIPILLIITGTGIDNFWETQIYLATDNKILRSAGIILSPLAVVFIGYLTSEYQGFNKIILILNSFTYFIVNLALASRFSALVYLLTAFGYSLNSRSRNNTVRIFFFFSTLLIPILFSLSFYLRSQKELGLLFLFKIISSGQISEAFDLSRMITSTFNSFIFSYFVTYPIIQTIESSEYPIENYITSVNPLPGPLTNWNELVSSGYSRLNIFTPFNTIGELFVYGLPIGIFSFLIVGYFMTNLSRIVDDEYFKNKKIVKITVISLTIAFCYTASQYNLRSSSRFLYYAVIYIMILKMLRKFR